MELPFLKFLCRMEAQFVKLGLPIDRQIAPDPAEDGIDDYDSTPRYIGENEFFSCFRFAYNRKSS
jgi:hypothetical protein